MRIEVREDCVEIDGYVNAVGRDSRMIPSPRGPFVEQVVPGTFQRALSRNSNVDVMLNHERVLGSTGSGDLALFEDSIGLRAKARITDADVIEKARRKELRGWSFGFEKPKARWEERDSAPPRRYLDDFELREVSIIDNRKLPAYTATSIELRGGEEEIFEYRAFDDEVEYEIPEPPQEKAPAEERSISDPRTIMAGYRARRHRLTFNGGKNE